MSEAEAALSYGALMGVSPEYAFAALLAAVPDHEREAVLASLVMLADGGVA